MASWVAVHVGWTVFLGADNLTSRFAFGLGAGPEHGGSTSMLRAFEVRASGMH